MSGVAQGDGARQNPGPPVLVVMGVAGVGKSTVAQGLVARLGWAFMEGDALHPPANVAKMQAGVPLTDADRAPWLAAIAAWIDRQRAERQPGIVTCSALKRAYRRILVGDRPNVRLVYLRGGQDLVAQRLAGRSGHFMPARLLQSQFDTLEEPAPDENVLTLDVAPPPDQIADEIIRRLGATSIATENPA